jgi:RimJ/RimL family protein N-acetyltransferase
MTRLQTPRLVLEPLSVDDGQFMLELLTDPEFIAHVGDRQVRTREQAVAYLETRVLPSFAEHGFGMLALRLKDSGETVGLCGLVARAGLDDVDIGYALLPRFRGAGLALEAARRVLDWAIDLGMRRVVAIVTPENAPSIALLEQLGMIHESMVTLPGEDEALRFYAWEADEVTLLCRATMRAIFSDEGTIAWSSAMLEHAMQAVATAVGNVPEPLVRAAWDALATRPLDESCYQFCRDFGRHLLSGFRGHPGWCLDWMLGKCAPSRACLRYWTLGVKPELWQADVEAATRRVLSGYPFQF